MAITSNDVKLYKSVRMTDFADGGGPMSPNLVVDGVDNNVFDDLTDLDRAAGRISLRKVFGAVVSNNADTYLAAFAFLDSGPADPDTHAALFKYGGLTAERAAAVGTLTPLNAGVPYPTGTFAHADYSCVGTATAGSASLTGCVYPDSALFDSVAGRALVVSGPVGGVTRQALRRVVSRSGGTVVLDAPLPWSGTVTGFHLASIGVNHPRPYGVATLTAAAASGDVALEVDNPLVQVFPMEDGGVSPAATTDLPSPSAFSPTCGYLSMFRGGDIVLLHHTALDTAIRANGDVFSAGRTDLSRVRVVGHDGVEIARFDARVTPPTGVGCTCNLTTGTLTFTNVAGMAQPVTVEHRIEELHSLVIEPQTRTLNLLRSVSRAYPVGAKVSPLMLFGDLNGRAGATFAQGTWTTVWSDTRIGAEPLADYNDAVYPIAMTNAGAVTERWLILFTNSTTFKVVGEQLGEIGGGTTGTICQPINPATGAPYFQIDPAGWGLSWAAGNCLRFNTEGASVPLWALRCVAPSLPGGDDSATVEFRGYVNV